MAIRIDSSMNSCGFRADAAGVASLGGRHDRSRWLVAASADAVRQRSGKPAASRPWRGAKIPGCPSIYLKFLSLPLSAAVPAGRA